MNPSELNQRIRIRKPSATRDAAGQPLRDFADVCTLWARIRTLSGSEGVKAGAETSIVQAEIRVHFRTGIDAGMIAVHGSTTYRIKAVLPDFASKEYTQLLCEVVS